MMIFVARRWLVLGLATNCMVSFVHMKTDYTRSELIDLCEKAIVNIKNWSDRDSAEAQRQIGDGWALLKSGCPFTVLSEGNLITDNTTIWIEHRFTDFMGYECDCAENATETSYIPTQSRLDEAKGTDWY